MDPAERQIVQYLLDELDLHERESVDERTCQDPSFFELVCAIEDDLILWYVRGELTSEQRARFEVVYLANPSKRARVESARILKGSLSKAAPEQNARQPRRRMVPAGLQWGLAFAAGLLLLAMVLWFPFRGDRSRQTFPSAVSKAPPSTGESVSFVLEPGLLRSGAGNQISVPASAQMARFELKIGASLPSGEFEAILGTPENPGIWKGAAFPQNHSLSVSVPTSVLATGDYTLSVLATGNSQTAPAVATYYFRVVKPAPHPGQP
jgi:hypothetical protein